MVVGMLLAVVGLLRSSDEGDSGSGRMADHISGFVQLDVPELDVPISASLSATFSRVISESDYTRECKRSSESFVFFLELRSSNGRVLCRWSFEAIPPSTYDPAILFDPETEEYYTTFDEVSKLNRQVPFSYIVVNPPDYSSIAVLHENEELLVQHRSANTPSLSIQGPTAGQVFTADDSVALSWQGSDIDGDELDYLVFYSTDGGDSYERLRIASRNSPKTISASRLESSSQARLAVSVSDGTRSMFAETEIFTVVKNVPAETTVSPANLPPKAFDDTARGYVDGALQIYVLENDIYSETDFDPQSLKIDVFPSFGVAYVYDARTPYDTERIRALRPFIIYIPGSAGTDELTYSICNTVDQCDTAEVTIKAGTADCTIVGTEDDDILRGTPGDDIICGLAGDDTIYPGDGDDTLEGSTEQDTIIQ